MSKPGKCSYCGREVRWIRTSQGKLTPVELRLIRAYTEAGDFIKVRESHFAHCPQYLAAQERKRLRARYSREGAEDAFVDGKSAAAGG